ncbi:hypothetical protein WT12_08335 [Burkholderia territorii]|uniref:hypothetical protein n=1 Tax=Burkholderia territorii TaxID=1503055 RepID=UPI000759E519|nr:hypothetical protein [Burkholderia territorii]KVN48744.1 hypothetical protein WT12_08335 [Burkholderia territorii]
MEEKAEIDSWYSRNDWARPLVSSFILVLAPLVVSTLPDGSGVVFPRWASIVASGGACLGLLIAGVKARLSNTLSARIFCSLSIGLGYAIAIYQIIDAVKH